MLDAPRGCSLQAARSQHRSGGSNPAERHPVSFSRRTNKNGTSEDVLIFVPKRIRSQVTNNNCSPYSNSSKCSRPRRAGPKGPRLASFESSPAATKYNKTRAYAQVLVFGAPGRSFDSYRICAAFGYFASLSLLKISQTAFRILPKDTPCLSPSARTKIAQA